MSDEDLLHAATPEGIAFRKNGLHNLHQCLLAKTDWESEDQRTQTLVQFYQLASQLRELDLQLAYSMNLKEHHEDI